MVNSQSQQRCGEVGIILYGLMGWCVCLVTQSCLTLWDPMDCSLPGSPLFMGFSRPEYWSGLPCPPPRDRPSPGIEPESPALAGGFFTTEPPEKPQSICYVSFIISKIYHKHTYLYTDLLFSLESWLLMFTSIPQSRQHLCLGFWKSAFKLWLC